MGKTRRGNDEYSGPKWERIVRDDEEREEDTDEKWERELEEALDKI